MLTRKCISLTDYPKVTQVAGMFYTEQTWGTPSLTHIHMFWCKVVTGVFVFLDGLKHVEEIRFSKCIYIEDACLERLSSIENLQESLYMMEVVSCGNVTDKGIVALHKLRSAFINDAILSV